jgi:hypothetical protein
MLRRFLSLSFGTLALLLVLGAPGQVHAQHIRGAMPHGGHPVFRGRMTPGFRGGFDRRFDRRFFEPRFDRRFDRFEDRFNRGFFDPRFTPGFGPTFIRPF